ncbi:MULTISPECIES: glycine cleavage system aminomethyltransferase GcvT [unclassified Roseofilum]|uniref:glycine cleavage system aminomethyltransferase GcvT n=1 Tax=unclassified Roseofilum TaxID=2620099 RepID=UPI000E7F2C3A|nr:MULTISPECIES: glycine cleavage system aminomethyltransferase GcvT [unclassified Roseofilum]HBQ99441.1 glycine cleavage system aminomethyltransferase GcvT [Cyanobacteria bacterium UBA11691]MBP0011360.1 glycine cleavage system aminomethyltransferase GcvT [Roseofilum sp. Belize Diploria]MBP0012017.1 glycine cleavage system aminomethyltransferase GcvT [Roseofilum sp. SID3]MBP0026136.1 glycine cleavage system aminomethyltransferase GcvT [Roseofilum sp. SID2]MBP0036886.1 glycine cleavage system a
MALLHTPLFDSCVKLKAKMTEFSGWEMPVQFSGIKQEHEAVRTHVGMFDISHMGKFFLSGASVIASLQTLVPSDLARLKPGQAQYTVLLNSEGGIIDDIIVYLQSQEDNGEEKVAIIVNAATCEGDRQWIQQHLDPDKIQFDDQTLNQALIALQGPKALETLQTLVTTNLSSIPRFGHIPIPLLGSWSFLARTGYTGEDGVEIMLDPDTALQLWDTLLQTGVIPCGLGARDTLRLEAALALYGQDIDLTTTPLEAGLKWLVHLKTKGDFIGRSVLEEQQANGVSKRLVGLQGEGRHIARHGYPLLASGEVVSEVASGTLSPTLGYPIAMAYLPKKWAKIGQELEVEIRGKRYPMKVVKKPFYRAG